MSIGGQLKLPDPIPADTATAGRAQTGVWYSTRNATVDSGRIFPVSPQRYRRVGAARERTYMAVDWSQDLSDEVTSAVARLVATHHITSGMCGLTDILTWPDSEDAVSPSAASAESEPQDSLAAYAAGFFRLCPDARMWCTLAQVECAGRTYPFPRGLTIFVYRDEDQFVCAHRGLRLYGMGANYAEAFAEFCEFFDVLYQEYVDTADPLDSGAQRLAQRLRDLVRA